MQVLEHLEPKKVFSLFEAMCTIPHGSRNTKAISDWCVAFAKERRTPVAHGADIGKQGVIGERGHAYVVKVKHIRGAGVVIVGGKQQAVARISGIFS